MTDGSRHNDSHGMMVGGLIVLGIGVLFLLRNLGYIPAFSVLWPVIPIIVGAALIIGALLRMRDPGRS